MFPLGFALGAVAGAAAVLLTNAKVAQQARPAAKAVLKAALTVMHGVRVQSAEIVEAAEDLYAEAKAEAAQSVMAAAMARAEQAEPAGSGNGHDAGPSPHG